MFYKECEKELTILKELYEKSGYEVYEAEDNALCASCMIMSEKYLVCIIAPTESNGKWLMRADSFVTFDKWSNCMWENWFDDFDTLLKFRNKWFWTIDYEDTDYVNSIAKDFWDV